MTPHPAAALRTLLSFFPSSARAPFSSSTPPCSAQPPPGPLGPPARPPAGRAATPLVRSRGGRRGKVGDGRRWGTRGTPPPSLPPTAGSKGGARPAPLSRLAPPGGPAGGSPSARRHRSIVVDQAGGVPAWKNARGTRPRHAADAWGAGRTFFAHLKKRGPGAACVPPDPRCACVVRQRARREKRGNARTQACAGGEREQHTLSIAHPLFFQPHQRG